jgi:hypothetical protein
MGLSMPLAELIAGVERRTSNAAASP